ncbi:MAG: hypothetical protein LC104_06025 [Bacteroidales bacterium]|nr:hypothetical protein [Bacteroidales bacterium]
MKERRPLVAGITPVDRSTEEQFVYANKATKPAADLPQANTTMTNAILKTESIASSNRTPISTRIRADFAAALKRASLERQLSGTTPNTLQDILEDALEPWLRRHGYLP